MKQAWPLLCAALIALSAGPPAHAGDRDPKFRDRGDRSSQGVARDNSGAGRGGERGGERNGGRNDPWGEDRRDDRINSATRIASRRGRVLDAGQQSGSIFWVRVATAQGRVDLLIDTDTGQIVGER